MNQELQARLDARGVTDDDDKPIRVVEDKPGIKKSAQRALFDLHSTRVSILSALATEGGVPLAILSKCVAGHASIVMTLYYIKPGQTQINKTLQEASARLEDKEVENFKRLVREHAANKTKTIPIAVVSNAAGVDALDPKTSAGWIYSDIGMCPVGGTMCSQGGEKSDLDRGYRPVPGGARNCPSCRFFITGPAFIGGLEARFNAASFGCKEIGARRLAALKAMERFQDELFDAEVSQRPKEEIKVLRKRFDAAQDHFEQAHAQHDQALHDWHRLTALMNRCWQAVRSVQESEKQSDGAAQPLALVLSGTTADLASAVHLTSDWELTQRVCEASILYPVAETPVAVMRRAQILDRFLARADSAPVFSQLSDADSLTMANQFVALLHARLGPKRVDHLMSGTSAPTLEDRRALAAALGGKARMTAPLDAPAALLLPQESEAA